MDKCASCKMTVKAEEHEKQCPHAVPGGGSGDALQVRQACAWLPANRFALVLPEISRVHAAFTVSISKFQAPVMMLGPCGGTGGEAVNMNVEGVDRIVRVVVRHCNAVDAMTVVYEWEGMQMMTDQWGGQGGKPSEFGLQRDEYLTSVEGHYGEFKGNFVIRSLKFVSNTRTYGPYGKEDGVPFALPAAAGGKIIGFHGRSGVFLNAIGTYVKIDY